jgi:molybdopterin-biosynthesis enzyme MoeA-like protein
MSEHAVVDFKESSPAFGLVVIGDEVLNGPRADSHLAAFKLRLGVRGLSLAWHWMLPDEPEVIVDHLRFSMSRSDPVFVCGGIGATPDDHTRASAAEAAGVPLTRHAEARALIEERFGAEAYPHRILMADLPDNCELIPNPYNRIPGFFIRNHWFLPGFPEMAWPMAEWVLDGSFGSAQRVSEGAVEVLGVAESRLIPLMLDLGQRYPRLKMFSLPHLGGASGGDPHILLGFRGRDEVEEALDALRAELAGAAMPFRERGGGQPLPTPDDNPIL